MNNGKAIWIVALSGTLILGGLMASLAMSPPAIDTAHVREFAKSKRRRVR